MTTGSTEPESSDRGIEALLEAVGARHEPGADVADEVRVGVYAEWQSLINRRRRRRILGWGIAASVPLAILATSIVTRAVETAPAQIASIANINGELTSAAIDTPTIQGTVGQPVRVGDKLQTNHTSRAALAFPAGLSLRLDQDTRLTIAATDRVMLTTGAVYIDVPPGTRAASSLTVETASGSVQHLGTQYEVRSHADGMVVSVREGRVVVTNARGRNFGEAGQVLRVSADGNLSRGELSSTAAQWLWAFQAGPTFDIEGQSLAQFLRWVARETGRQLKYSSPQAEATAATVRLRGSIEGLDPDAALIAVLLTTRLRRYQTADAELGIELLPVDSPDR